MFFPVLVSNFRCVFQQNGSRDCAGPSLLKSCMRTTFRVESRKGCLHGSCMGWKLRFHLIAFKRDPLVNDHIAGWNMPIFNGKYGYVFKGSIFHCYVSLPGCIYFTHVLLSRKCFPWESFKIEKTQRPTVHFTGSNLGPKALLEAFVCTLSAHNNS